MQNRKLIHVLQGFQPGQMDRLRDFARSPYYNKDNTLVALLEYLLTLYPKFRAMSLEKERVIRRVPGIADENELNKKLTALFALTEKFLAVEQRCDPFLEKINALRAYKLMKLPKQFEALACQLRKELDSVAFKDFDHLWRVHKFEEEMFEGFENNIHRTPDNRMDEVLNSLSRFYFIKKLRYLTEAINRKNLLGNEIAETSRAEVITFLNSQKSYDLYLQLYGNIYLLYSEKSVEKAKNYYQQVKTTLITFSKDILIEDVLNICVYIQNYCYQKINLGNKEFMQDFFEIINFRINENVLLEFNKLSPQLFKNIVSNALMLNEINWVESFINNYKKYLPSEDKSDYYHYVMGHLFYHKKDFKKAGRYLSIASHNRQDVYFNLAVKKLQLKMGYEESSLILDATLEAYRRQLDRYRHKIGNNAVLLEKFYTYFRALANATDYDKREILLSELLAEGQFPDKDWLVKMAAKNLRKSSPLTSLLAAYEQPVVA